MVGSTEAGSALPFSILEIGLDGMEGAAIAVARDERAATVCRGFLSAIELRKICEVLDQSASVDRGDFVPGFVKGAFHYLKSVPDYLQSCSKENPAMERFIATTPVSRLFEYLAASAAAEGFTFRRASLAGTPLSAGVLRQWSDNGDLLLRAHEDWSQLGDPKQAALELFKVGPTAVGVNLCLRNEDESGEAGTLLLWSRRVEDRERAPLGRRQPWSGYPYDEEELRHRVMMKIPIRAGDLYFINSRYVHAVASGGIQSISPRVNFSIAMGLHETGNLIYWA